jgi:type II secretory pathway pseudopilin PulG
VIKPVQREKNGFAMLVIFLLAAAVAITLYYEMPRVAFESQRNREELLMARGEQYKRAIELYFRKTKKYPQDIKELENTNNFRFLRRRYIDPLTGKDEWRLVHMGPAGLTDSLVEKMPGLDGDKKSGTGNGGVQSASMGGGSGSTNFGTSMASMTSSSTGAAPVKDPNAPKTADDIVVGSNRTERDQRALMAQRGQAPRILQPGEPGYDPYVAKMQQEEAERRAAAGAAAGDNADPNAQFQQQLLAEYQKQQQQTQQQMQAAGGAANPTPGQIGPVGNPADPNAPQQTPINPAQAALMGNNGNNNGNTGPVRTLYPTQSNPFSAGNQIRNGPGFPAQQAPTPPSPPGQQPTVGPSGGPMPSAFNVPEVVKGQLMNPNRGSPTTATGNNATFGGGGIAGVASNAPGTGIKRYNERGKYKEWEFVYDYRKPAKGAQKGVTGVGGLNTSGGNSGGGSGQRPPSSGGMQGLFGGSSGSNR